MEHGGHTPLSQNETAHAQLTLCIDHELTPHLQTQNSNTPPPKPRPGLFDQPAQPLPSPHRLHTGYRWIGVAALSGVRGGLCLGLGLCLGRVRGGAHVRGRGLREGLLRAPGAAGRRLLQLQLNLQIHTAQHRTRGNVIVTGETHRSCVAVE